MTTRETEIADEQKYFDIAWDARERHRQVLREGPAAAAGSQAATRAVRRDLKKMLEGMPGPDEEVAFGRVDLDNGEETYYLGKYSILNDARDVLVVNWQLERFANYFYKSSIADTLGVARKRAFTTDRNAITDLQDTVFAELLENVEALTAEEKLGVNDVLLDDLAKSRDGEMHDIVRTIQASQYDLIRRPLDELLIIQGGPGTGKTAVALHRVSWLLFNHRADISPSDILVVGPSKTFNRYIRNVLPGLGDNEVTHADLTGLGPVVASRPDETDDVVHLKGSLRMAALLQRALQLRVRFPEGPENLVVGAGARSVAIPKSEIEAQINQLRSLPTYNAGRLAMRAWLTQAANTRIRGSMRLEAQAVDTALERVWPQLTAVAFLQDLLGSRQRLLLAAGDEFTAGDVDRLYRQGTNKLADERWSTADIALLDEADELINGRGATFLHVVVDEAQDLSPLQLRSIRRRSPRGSCTIVGDIAQATGVWARSEWDDVIEGLTQDFKPHVAALDIGYRVPRQVMELADRLLPQIAPDLEPARVIRSGPADPEIRSVADDELTEAALTTIRNHAANGRFVGAICPAGELHDQLTAALRSADVTFADAADGQLGSTITVLTASQAKGLEFDAAVVIEPALLAGTELAGLRLLYVALTRTTKYLSVIHSRQFAPLGLTEGEPQPVGDLAPTFPTAPFDAQDEVVTGVSVRHGMDASPVRSGGFGDRMVIANAKMLADEIRDSVAPEAHAALLRALAEELGVSVEE